MKSQRGSRESPLPPHLHGTVTVARMVTGATVEFERRAQARTARRDPLRPARNLAHGVLPRPSTMARSEPFPGALGFVPDRECAAPMTRVAVPDGRTILRPGCIRRTGMRHAGDER